MTIPECMRLENSAIIYPSCQTRKYASVFRMSATMDEDVDPSLLGTALEDAIKRFPGFRFTVKRGLFWWFLRRLENEPSVRPHSKLDAFDIRRNGGYMFKLSCSGPHIYLDVFHALTDGTGAMTFLMSVISRYLTLSGYGQNESSKWVLDSSSEPAESEIEDGFDNFSGTSGSLDKEQKAYHVKGRNEPSGILNSMGVSMSEDAVTAKAKELDCTVTELLSTLILLSLQDIWKKDGRRRKSPHLRLEIPVNLRPFFGSKSLRNFSSYIHVGLDLSNGEYSFQDALREIKYQKRLYTQPGRLMKRIAANVALEENLAVRCAPLFIKRPVINLINRLKGDNYSSCSLSNLGKIELPEAMSAHIKDLHFVLGRTRYRPGSCACLSYGGRLNMNFSRKIAGDELERTFVRKLRDLGIWSTIYVPAPPLRPSNYYQESSRPVFRSNRLFPKYMLSI